MGWLVWCELGYFGGVLETRKHRLIIVCLFTQRNLNNAFAYDLVPSPSVLAAALKAARRVNDFATAVRIFEGTPPPSLPSPQIINRSFTLPHNILLHLGYPPTSFGVNKRKMLLTTG